MKMYRGAFYPGYRNDEGQMRECEQVLLFTAESDAAACLNFCVYVTRVFDAMVPYKRELQRGDWLYVGCIKIDEWRIAPLDQAGNCYTGVCGGVGHVMEWKCDMGLYRPKNPESILAAAVRAIKNMVRREA